MRAMFFRIFTAVLVLACVANAQTPQQFDSFIRPYVASKNFSGNVLIELHGKVVFQRYYGYSDREHKRANGNRSLHAVTA